MIVLARPLVVTALIAGAVVTGAAGLWLVVVCWKTRTVLGGLLGALGTGLTAFAGASGLDGRVGSEALILAVVALIVGFILYRLGQAFERLLDDEPRDDR